MKILIATGGSGGHVFPAIKTALELREDGHDVIFAGAFGKMEDLITHEGFLLHRIPARGLSTASVKDFLDSCFCMSRGMVQSLRLLRKLRPQVVCGFGGYGAFPVVLSGFLLRFRTLIHEQNVIPGKANALLSRLVDRIMVSFEQSLKHFPYDKTVLVGCPGRMPGPQESRSELLDHFHFTEGKLVLLVLGGSQGSHKINDTVLETLKSWDDPGSIQIIHVTGDRDYEDVLQAYRSLPVTSCVFDFLKEMEKAYTVCDVVISRAGAVSISELVAFRRQAVLIPYPGAGGHQKANAQVLSGAGVATLIEDKDLNASNLKVAVETLLKNRLPAEEFSARVKHIPDAETRVAREIIQPGA